MFVLVDKMGCNTPSKEEIKPLTFWLKSHITPSAICLWGQEDVTSQLTSGLCVDTVMRDYGDHLSQRADSC